MPSGVGSSSAVPSRAGRCGQVAAIARLVDLVKWEVGTEAFPNHPIFNFDAELGGRDCTPSVKGGTPFFWGANQFAVS